MNLKRNEDKIKKRCGSLTTKVLGEHIEAFAQTIYDCFQNFCLYTDLPDIQFMAMDVTQTDADAVGYIKTFIYTKIKEKIDINYSFYRVFEEYFEYKLWELQLAVLYCEEDNNCKEAMLKHFKSSYELLIIKEPVWGREQDEAQLYMSLYVRYLLIKFERDKNNKYAIYQYRHDCDIIEDYCRRRCNIANNLKFFQLLCKVSEINCEALEVETNYRSFQNFLTLEKRNEKLLSESYYDFAHYVEELGKREPWQYTKIGGRRTIVLNYRLSLHTYRDNYRALYKLIFYDDEKKKRYRLSAIRLFKNALEELPDSFRTRLYLYKADILHGEWGNMDYHIDYVSSQIVSANRNLRYKILPLWHYLMDDFMDDFEDNNGIDSPICNYLNTAILKYFNYENEEHHIGLEEQ